MEIERELSARAVEELAEWELGALAEGVRDKHYRPVMEAQDEATRLAERRRREEQEQQRNRVRDDAERGERQRGEARRAAEQRASQEAPVSALLEHGMDFACDALREVDDLDPRDRRSILQRVAGELEAELTGKESEQAVEARVDEILDEELGKAEDADEDDEDDTYEEDEDPSDEDDEDKEDEDED